MVVMALKPIDPADTEEPLQVLERRQAIFGLRHHEPMNHLEPESVAGSVQAAALADETDREASFSVYKPGDPANPDQPFLLVFRTSRIVTADHDDMVRRVPDGYTGFPAYSRMLAATLLSLTVHCSLSVSRKSCIFSFG